MAEEMRIESGRWRRTWIGDGEGTSGRKDSGSVTVRGWSECVPQPLAVLRRAAAAAGAYRSATRVLHVTGPRVPRQITPVVSPGATE